MYAEGMPAERWLATVVEPPAKLAGEKAMDAKGIYAGIYAEARRLIEEADREALSDPEPGWPEKMPVHDEDGRMQAFIAATIVAMIESNPAPSWSLDPRDLERAIIEDWR